MVAVAEPSGPRKISVLTGRWLFELSADLQDGTTPFGSGEELKKRPHMTNKKLDDLKRKAAKLGITARQMFEKERGELLKLYLERRRKEEAPLFRGKLTKKFLFELPFDLFLVSSTMRGIGSPVWGEAVASEKNREAQWRRIVVAKVCGKNCLVFNSVPDFWQFCKGNQRVT